MIDMCNALEELRQEGVQEGRQEERLRNIRILIQTCQEYNKSKEVAVEKLIEYYSLSENEAADYVNRYWESGN